MRLGIASSDPSSLIGNNSFTSIDLLSAHLGITLTRWLFISVGNKWISYKAQWEKKSCTLVPRARIQGTYV